MRARILKQRDNSAAPLTRLPQLSRPSPVQAKKAAPSLEKDPAEIAQQAPNAARPGFNFGQINVSDPRQQPSGTGGGNPMPEVLRKKMELAFHSDFSDVRVHMGPDPESLNALAFTQGRDIHFAPGQYQPASAEGQRIIAHELTHVIQQRGGGDSLQRFLSCGTASQCPVPTRAERSRAASGPKRRSEK